MLDPKGEKLVATLRASGQQALMLQADQVEDAAQQFWRQKKQQ